LNPESLQYPYFLGMMAVRSGNLAEARAHFRRAGATVGDSAFLLPLADGLADAAARERALGMLRAWESGGPLPDVSIARWYVDLGATEDALRVLERGVARRAPYMTYLDYFELDPLAVEPRYQALRRRIGFGVTGR
jgi:hypothetical protein